ncbi:uncharacterized protein LOC126374232 [Pectinophora gossypiella]|uniref:uncharacterized protein LOC126374232 n=1 Tax=Pectinophora gossypiella TaxID=13191 RepID=UPI00214E14CC|nr:uncharacterized protein LOC126374232 [Pectinophora gossypiella]
MHTNALIFFASTILLSAVHNAKCSRSENQCVDYYQTGNDFDLKTLAGVRWYVVYLWPPSARTRAACEAINFNVLSRQETEATFSDCRGERPDGAVIHATYHNTAGKLTSVTYYGEEEVKSLFRGCDRIYKYIFLQINENYVLGINCSSMGRGILLAKFLPTREQVDATVRDIEIMKGRDGSPDCNLP